MYLDHKNWKNKMGGKIMAVIVKMIDELKETGIPEKPPVHDGKQIVALINPK